MTLESVSRHRSADLSTLRGPELVIISVPGQGVRPQHLVALLVAHYLIVGFVESDPHLHMLAELSVAKPGIVCKRLRSSTEKRPCSSLHAHLDRVCDLFHVSPLEGSENANSQRGKFLLTCSASCERCPVAQAGCFAGVCGTTV